MNWSVFQGRSRTESCMTAILCRLKPTACGFLRAAFLLLVISLWWSEIAAQSANPISKPEVGARVDPAPPASVLPAVGVSAVANSGDPSVEASKAPEPPLRVERLSLAGGAEL